MFIVLRLTSGELSSLCSGLQTDASSKCPLGQTVPERVLGGEGYFDLYSPSPGKMRLRLPWVFCTAEYHAAWNTKLYKDIEFHLGQWTPTDPDSHCCREINLGFFYAAMIQFLKKHNFCYVRARPWFSDITVDIVSVWKLQVETGTYGNYDVSTRVCFLMESFITTRPFLPPCLLHVWLSTVPPQLQSKQRNACSHFSTLLFPSRFCN